MRRTTLTTAVVGLLAVSGCGSGTKFANRARPAIPINLTVYINNVRVSVSPRSVGAGEVVFIVSNGSARAQSLTISQVGQNRKLASTGPINPQGTGQVTVDFARQGLYAVSSSGAGGGTDATLATQAPIKPALIHIGPPRPSASNQLLLP